MIWALLLATFVTTDTGKLATMVVMVDEFESREVCEMAKGQFIRENEIFFKAGEGMTVCRLKGTET